MFGYKAVNNHVEQNKKLKESDESSLVTKGRYQRLGDGSKVNFWHDM